MPTISGEILDKGLKVPHLRLVIAHIKKHVEEWLVAYNKEDPQLVDAYSYVGRKRLKEIIDTFTTVAGKISTHMESVKTIRKPRKINKEVRVRKLKFLPSLYGHDTEPATSIIGATTVWVFDTKYRKLSLIHI